MQLMVLKLQHLPKRDVHLLNQEGEFLKLGHEMHTTLVPYGPADNSGIVCQTR